MSVSDQSELCSRMSALASGSEPVFLWSGGRDSTALLTLAAEYAAMSGCRVQAWIVPYPHHCTRHEHLGTAAQLLSSSGIALEVLDVESHDPCQGATAPCQECKQHRRAAFARRLAGELSDRPLALITGHTLSDLAAYAVETFVSAMNAAGGLVEIGNPDRRLEVLNRFLPRYDSASGHSIVRPLLSCSDLEIDSLVARAPLPHPSSVLPESCRWAVGRKRLLQTYFEETGAVFGFDRVTQAVRLLVDDAACLDYGALPIEYYLV